MDNFTSLLTAVGTSFLSFVIYDLEIIKPTKAYL